MGVTTRLYSEGLDIDRAVHGLCRAFGTLCLTVPLFLDCLGLSLDLHFHRLTVGLSLRQASNLLGRGLTVRI